ncbi:MAG TPA: sugar ABC transporter permease [Anaerolineae bacterium]|nr:sugar ABC transporter permease [Anaerolineae bacterium]
MYLSVTEDIIGKLPDTVPEEFLGAENMAQLLADDAKRVTFDNYLIKLPSFEIAKVTINDESTALIVVRGDNVTAYGLQNYVFAFTSPDMHIAFRNNILWLVFGTSFSVGLGLLIATLVDRIKRESLAKSFIFLPLAISFVGASVIWKFVYAWQPAGRPQIGVLNAVVTALGFEPIPWLITPPLNTFALILIMIWLQTGFAMVILSAALKGVPQELLEAARIDGANEIQIFFKVIIPSIRGAIITVATTIFISILKVFDIVFVMTSGKFETEVIANRMFVEMFNFRNFGRASALAVILLVVVIPIMVVNIHNLRKQGVNQ